VLNSAEQRLFLQLFQQAIAGMAADRRACSRAIAFAIKAGLAQGFDPSSMAMVQAMRIQLPSGKSWFVAFT
jgi:hypothetical protein